MARSLHSQADRRHGENILQKGATWVQRGVGTVMAAKGAWDTARQLYSFAAEAAPYVRAGLSMMA